MKTGIASCVLERKFSVEEAMRVARDLGYVGYEIDVGPEPHYSIFGGETDLSRMRDFHRWNRLGQVAESVGIKICSICIGALHSYGLADPNKEVRDQGISILKTTCKAAADIGVDKILVPFQQPADIEILVAQSYIIDSLKKCIDTAQEYGTLLAVENMPNDLYGPANKIVEVIEQIGSEYCQVYYDIANPEVKQIHAKDEIPILSNLIKQVHIKDLKIKSSEGEIEVVNIGEGDLDLKSGIGALKGINYEGFVVVEVPTKASDAFKAAEINLKGLVTLFSTK